MQRKNIEAIKRAAERAGVKYLRTETAGVHLKAYVEKDGVVRFVTVSISNSDWKRELNIARDMKMAFLK